MIAQLIISITTALANS